MLFYFIFKENLFIYLKIMSVFKFINWSFSWIFSIFNESKNYKKKKVLNSKFYKKYKIIIILILIFFILYNYIKTINIKVCICTLGKNENKYIKEFVEHYKKYGVDKIYLYDNNDIGGEKFEYVINDYIKNGYVQILNWRGQKKALYKIMNNCYQNNYKKYDFLLFYEIDEYIYLYNYTNIKKFLTLERFKECELIYLNLICHTDNNKLYYEDKPLVKRFPKKVSFNKKSGIKLEIKFILRGHIPNIHIDNVHRGNYKNKNCNGFGNINKFKVIYTTEPDYKYFYIDHYYSKSTEEFINKINKKPSPIYNNIGFLYERINKYLSENEISLEKIEMIENGTGLNLSKYKKNINLIKLI